MNNTLPGWGKGIVSSVVLASAPWVGAQTTEWITTGPTAGPVVVILSGASGVAPYREFGQKIAALGYAALLVDGNEVSILGAQSAANLSRVLSQALADQRAQPGKVAVVGFSMGGGGALAHATSSEEAVAAVATYYPAVSVLPNPLKTAKEVKVPTLILAGGRDQLNNCCLVESAREFAKAVKADGGTIELVEYPQANHAFNLQGPSYREGDADDAWTRLRAFLTTHLPVGR
ncbi:MAG: alpha/beta family hydrolase [Pseudomonadota bacterium]